MNLVTASNVVSFKPVPRPRQLFREAQPDISQLQQWREEAMQSSSDWRSMSWRSQELYDGKQWTEEDIQKAKDAGIPYAITINRIFPTLNMILGSQVINKYNIMAKGRTKADSEIAQVMTEGIKFVFDQWDGDFKISLAFKDAVIPGIGWLAPCYSNDPRTERVKVNYRDWKEIWHDPHSSPWISPESCRYMFMQRWMDTRDLQAIFFEKAKDIEYAIGNISTSSRMNYNFDQATEVEEHSRFGTTGSWVQSERQRVRPCEMWYTVYETCLFATMPDTSVIEIAQDMPPMEQMQIVRAAQEITTALVKKLRVATFIGDLLLADVPSPYTHNQYPFVPFVGYIDRYNQPYGVPKQLLGQQEEVNRRRSMALALLNAKEVMIEEDAAADEYTIKDLYEEANKLDPFMVLKKNAIRDGKVKITDRSALAQQQINLMLQSEQEIEMVSGANAESLGYKSNATSQVALERRISQSNVVTATLFENHRRSLNLLGYQVSNLISSSWTTEKVLRVTDSLSGAERYIQINKAILGPNNVISMENDITSAKVDIVISQSPISDTIREQNINMIIEWIKKSPPEIIPQLIVVAMEMSDIPNKTQILDRIKPLLGIDPLQEDMTDKERKAMLAQQAQMQAQKAAIIEKMQQLAAEYDLNAKKLVNDKTAAEIEQIYANVQGISDKNVIAQDKNEVNRERIHFEGVKAGIKEAHDQHDDALADEQLDHQKAIDVMDADNKHNALMVKHASDVMKANSKPAPGSKSSAPAKTAQQDFNQRVTTRQNMNTINSMMPLVRANGEGV